MADGPPPGIEPGDDGIEYAIDGTEHSRDGYGNLVTVEEQREMQEEEEMLSQSIKADIAKRNDKVRDAHPVAFSIPQEVYTAAAEDPQSLSAADRALILSRGDLEARALVDPHGLTRAERYQILGWPSPDVVERRIRAATKPTGTELSTPAELFAKAEREGTPSLTPVELHLLGRGFSLDGSGFETDEDSDGEEDKHKDQGSSLFCKFGVPGNGEAYTAAVKEEGVNLEIVAMALMQSINAGALSVFASIGQPVPPVWQPPGQAMGQPPEQPQGIPQGQPMNELQGIPVGMPLGAPTGFGTGASIHFPQQPSSVGFGAPIGSVPAGGGAPSGPGGLGFAGPSAASPVFQHPPPQVPPQTGFGAFGLPGAPPFQPQQQHMGGPQGLGFGFGFGTPAAPAAPAAASGPAGAGSFPGPEETGAVLDQIADALMMMKYDHVVQKDLSKEDFFHCYDNVVTSLHGLALRFNASLPAPPLRARRLPFLIPPPPRLHLRPNPFGVRLSHDGRSVRSANRHSKNDNDLPHGSTQAPPWTAWSATIPHRMLVPSQVTTPFEEYVTSIQAWTEKEEQARRDHQAAQQTGQQQQEPPLFYNTPPGWPSISAPKHPYNIYFESVEDSEAAKAWPNGERSYARGKWDAMTADEQAVYAKLCEERRRQAWIDSFEYVAKIKY